MRSRSAEALGISYETLKTHNPELVYCYAPGFADGGPSQDDPAYDDIIQARSGMAALNADGEGRPQFVRTIVCDKVVGLHLAIAVLAGVTHRLKTGEGICIEAPMLESMAAFLLAEHLAGHSLVPAEGELGYSRLMSPHRQPYQTANGYIAILPYSTRHWQRFFELCDAPELVDDPRVTDPVLRSEHIDALYQEVSRFARQRTTAQWLALLQAADIPCAAVNQLDQLKDDPQLKVSQSFQQLSDPELGTITNLRTPFRIHGDRPAERADSPRPNARRTHLRDPDRAGHRRRSDQRDAGSRDYPLNRHTHQVSTCGRFLCVRAGAGGMLRNPATIQALDSAGSITSSSSKCEAMFTALPRSYIPATISS